MEKNYDDYFKHVERALNPDSIRKSAEDLRQLGVFEYQENSGWKPFHYPGFTLITPTCQLDGFNWETNKKLIEIKRQLAEILPPDRTIEAPDNALHMTVARLISGNLFDEKMDTEKEVEFLNYFKTLTGKHKVKKPIEFELKGVSLMSSGYIGVLAAPIDENELEVFQEFRNFIYMDQGLINFGVERKRPFMGHVTLYYIEKEIDFAKKEQLVDLILKINHEYFKEPLAYPVSRAEVRRFNGYLSFERQQDWPVFDFVV